MRGGEKCLEAILDIYPKAEVFTLILDKNKISKKILSHKIHTHPISKIPFIKKKYRNLIPLFPILLGKWPQLTGFDFVISSSHCVAKSFNTASLPHICYCYSPMRYIWDMFDDYFLRSEVPWWKKSLMKKLRTPLQKWDTHSANNVDQFIAISNFIRERIQNCYQLDSKVVYPFADLSFYTNDTSKREDFYLVVSALVPYKKIDIVIKAFNESKRKLIIIGSGPEKSNLQQVANNNISFAKWATNEEIRDHYRTARAFIFPGTEDFGITPVEAMACGCPIIAINRGGTTETVIDIEKDPINGTGLFFNEPNSQTLNKTIDQFERSQTEFPEDILRKQAEKFSVHQFQKGLQKAIELVCEKYH